MDDITKKFRETYDIWHKKVKPRIYKETTNITKGTHFMFRMVMSGVSSLIEEKKYSTVATRLHNLSNCIWPVNYRQNMRGVLRKVRNGLDELETIALKLAV